jgi:sugar phosphate permease
VSQADAHPAHPAPPAPAHARGLLAVRIFGCFAAGYFMSYGLRSVNAVLAPDLTADIALSHSQLGSLSSAYFLAFALMQLPLGVWLDRFGPRRVNALLMGIAALGCFAFSMADGFGGLWVARALVGLGVAAGLMASLTAFRQWFDPALQTRLAAWMLMAGTAGVLTVTVPVHLVLPVLGWRGVFRVAAGLLCVIGLLMWFVIPRGRESTPSGAAGAGSLSFLASMAGYKEVFRNGYFWRMSLTAGIVQGGFVAMQSLWVGPWLDKVLGFAGDARAERLFGFNFGLLLSFLALGWLAPRVPDERSALARIVVIGTAAVVALELAIALASGPSAWWVWIGYAAAATTYTLVQPRVGLAFPAHLAGRALTGFNLVIFSWMFLSQWGFGVAIDLARDAGLPEADGFRAAMIALAALHALCLTAFVAWPKRWGGR